MTISKTTQSEPTGQLRTNKARLWFASLRLWMWKYQPHLRERPVYNTAVVNEIEKGESADIKFKNVYAVIVWSIDFETVAYYMLFTRKGGYYLGRVKHLEYIENANVQRYSCN